MGRGYRFYLLIGALCVSGLLGACSDDDSVDVGDNGNAGPPQAMRTQDSRTFSVNQDQLAFSDDLPDDDTDRWTGTLDGAGYRVEVPKDDWNGILVMYAHGYRGTGEALTVDNPPIRQYLVANNYAWAASSYSTNYYDVRSGVEDTNNLANHFVDIASDNGRTLNAPMKTYIMGVSMGGHITAAAIEDETAANANHTVEYQAALPACGVVGGGDTEFDYLLNFTFAAQHVADMGPNAYPATGFDQSKIDAVLWNQPPPTFADLNPKTPKPKPADPTDQGLELQNIVEQLSGGDRPVFVNGFRGPYYNVVMGLGGSDGTVNGILARDLSGNQDFTYQFDGDSDVSAEEKMFNDSILRVMADPNANPPQPDGLRWIPRVNGQFSVPVLTLHGLGDLYVPFVNEQVYRRRAEKNGNGDMLVQRAIRSAPHCDFTGAEFVTAFQDLVDWEQNGDKPEGNNVLDADTISDDNYGCKFTSETHTGVPACPSASGDSDG